MRMTEEQYAARLRDKEINPAVDKEEYAARLRVQGITPKAPKPSKYRNTKTVCHGIEFDSKAEAERYAELLLLEKAGEIRGLVLQVKYELAPSVRINGRKRPPLRYFADFTYFVTNQCLGCKNMVVEDVKGSKKVTEGYRIKRHLMKSALGIDILETRK